MARIPEIRQRLNKLQTAGARGTIQRRSLWLAAGLFASLLTMVACTRVAKAADDTPAVENSSPPASMQESNSDPLAALGELGAASGSKVATPKENVDFNSEQLKKTTEEIARRTKEIMSVDTMLGQLSADNLFTAKSRAASAFSAQNDNDIRAAVFDLRVKDGAFENEAAQEEFLGHVREVVSTLLYAGQTREEAEKNGMKMWFPENSNRLTITNKSTKIEIVAEYLESLPELATPVSKSRSIAALTLLPGARDIGFERALKDPGFANQTAAWKTAVEAAKKHSADAAKHAREAIKNAQLQMRTGEQIRAARDASESGGFVTPPSPPTEPAPPVAPGQLN